MSVRIALSKRALEAPRPSGERDCGCELVFFGRVRGSEGGEPIRGLYYEHYPGMAERELEALALRILDRFEIDTLECDHRIGEVGVGEAAVRVVVRSRRRQEGLAALAEFLQELKRDVPIWKWGVRPGGERFPTNPAGRRASAPESS